MSSPALEKHYRVNELAALWGLSAKTVRRMFANEPGVIRVEQRPRHRQSQVRGARDSAVSRPTCSRALEPQTTPGGVAEPESTPRSKSQ